MEEVKAVVEAKKKAIRNQSHRCRRWINGKKAVGNYNDYFRARLRPIFGKAPHRECSNLAT